MRLTICPVTGYLRMLGLRGLGSATNPVWVMGVPCTETTERLLADPKLSDDVAISVCVALLQVIKQTATLANQHEQSTT